MEGSVNDGHAVPGHHAVALLQARIGSMSAGCTSNKLTVAHISAWGWYDFLVATAGLLLIKLVSIAILWIYST